MNLTDLLERRFSARWLFIGVGLMLSILVLVRFKAISYFWSPNGPLGPFKATLPNVYAYAIDSAVDMLFAVLFAALFILFLIPREVRQGKILTVHPKDIGQELKRALDDTSEYLFRGRSARYFRTNVLPVLCDQAKNQSRTKSIWLLLPDPADIEIMENYAFYRNGISFRGQGSQWTLWDIQREIISTIIAVAYHHGSNPHIDARIGLSKSYSLIRVDMASKTAILTREDPKSPAFKCFCDTVFYDSYREEIVQGIQQGIQVDLASVWIRGDPLSDVNIGLAMSRLGFSDDAADAGKVNEVCEGVIRPRNPYA